MAKKVEVKILRNLKRKFHEAAKAERVLMIWAYKELAPITIVFHAKLLNPQAEYLKGRQVVKAGMRFFY